jgi:hypothetical protein
MELFNTRLTSLDSAARIKPRPSGVTLWQPEIVVPEGVVMAQRPRVTIAEPAQRPDAVRAQIDATRSLLSSLADARQVLAGRAAAAEAQELDAGSERERVAAMIETYRVKSVLEDVLQGTLRQMNALMGERGRR